MSVSHYPMTLMLPRTKFERMPPKDVGRVPFLSVTYALCQTFGFCSIFSRTSYAFDFDIVWSSTGCPKRKGIDKKLSFGTAHNFNSQFLNLFGFSMSVSFVWCFIWKIWTDLGKVTAVFRRCTCFFSVQIQ